jgi:ATP-dependent RNA helicase DDX52/ROK1
VKQEEGVEGEASEEDEMVDDGENDLAEEEEASDDEAEEEGVQLFGRTKGAATTDDGSDAEDADDSTSTSARVRALKSFRREAGIHVSGSDIPAPFREFSDLCAAGGALGVPEYMVKNLSRPVVEGGCGYEKPTAIQQQAVPILLKGRELLACAPTGSGKTAAFVIPILASLGKPGTVGFRALVLSPTRELAEQTHRCFTSVAAGRPFKIFHLNKANANSNNFGAQSNAKRDILITTPMRLVNLIQNEAIDLSQSVQWRQREREDTVKEAVALVAMLRLIRYVFAVCVCVCVPPPVWSG